MKYTKQGFAILVPINGTYTMRATICRTENAENTHDFTLELGREDTGIWQQLSSDSIYRIQAEKVNSETADYILTLYKNGHLKSAIENYEYRLKCASCRNRILEEAVNEIQKRQEV